MTATVTSVRTLCNSHTRIGPIGGIVCIKKTGPIDAKLLAGGGLPCLVCTEVAPGVAIPSARAQSIGSASVAETAAHAISSIGVAGYISRRCEAGVGVGAIGIVAAVRGENSEWDEQNNECGGCHGRRRNQSPLDNLPRLATGGCER